MKKIFPYTLCALVALLMFSCEPLIKPQHHFSVLFDANGGDGDMDALILAEGVVDRLAENSFQREGYTFVGWNTAPDGSGTSYDDAALFKTDQNITLYAQWKQVKGDENGHEWVDLDLPSGLKWATYNVGATKPEGYGDYFAWGETSPKDNYSWTTYKYCNGSSTTLTKYNTNSSYGTVDNKKQLDFSDDAARVNWGGKWRMPKAIEFEELYINCIWTWTSHNGINGYKVTSKNNGNSLFMPAAGWLADMEFEYVNKRGLYYADNINSLEPIAAKCLYFDYFETQSERIDFLSDYRYIGQAVRAVFSDNDTPSTFVTLTFDANGGEGTMAEQLFDVGVAQNIPTNKFTRSGYNFIGWNTNADGSGTSYTDGQEITLTQDITLYAQWEEIVTTGVENGYEWVDLGLPSGLKWATCNVGATTSEGSGDYFAWGETSPKVDYSWNTYKYCNGSSTTLTKYNNKSNYGTVDNKTSLDLIDDAARVNWGGTWRMPSKDELQELMQYCTWTLTTKNSIEGYEVKSLNNSNSIFLPKTGFCSGTSMIMTTDNNYWSNTLYDSQSYDAAHLCFGNSWGKEYLICENSTRSHGFAVRAVFSDNDKPSTFVTLSFDANGGQGTMAPQIFDPTVLQALNANTFTRDGHMFTGWNTAPDGSGTSFNDQAQVMIGGDLTLYAQWYAVSGFENEHAYVDLGLPSGTKWAICNLGATAPEGYGDYFAWGETAPKSHYNWSYYKHNRRSGTVNSLLKYNNNVNNGVVDNKTTLDAEDDAATVNWGGRWRIPSQTEQNELINNCNLTWVQQKGVNGYKLTSKINGNSIFLPAAGYRYNADLVSVGTHAYYWANSLYTFSSFDAVNLYYERTLVSVGKYSSRCIGYTVRAVISDDAPQTTIYTLTFDANGGTGTMAAQTFESGVSQAIAANTFTRDGYIFTGWNTKADGSGTSYTDKQSITISQNITLYAQWIQQSAVEVYVSYEANGGNGEMEMQVFKYGEKKSLLPCAFVAPSNFVFNGWNTKEDGTGTAYSDQQEITIYQDLTLYAQWKKGIYTVTFDANGGTGTMAAQTFEAGVSQAIKANTFTRSGYTFTGWNTKADGNGTSYRDKQIISVSKDITLYAQWKDVPRIENGREWVDLGLPSGLKWATCNVGATTPEGYGDYFAWGETTPKTNYDWSTYKYCNVSEATLTKYNYNSDYGTVDNKKQLDFSDDAARVNWGGKWRMPKAIEFEELYINCIWTWTSHNGINGYKVTSKNNGNSLFLPAAGYRYGTSVYEVGSHGYGWSSSLDEGHPYGVYCLDFGSGGVGWFGYYRYVGCTVRAVCP